MKVNPTPDKVIKNFNRSLIALVAVVYVCCAPVKARNRDLDEFLKSNAERNRKPDNHFYAGIGMPRNNFSGGLDGNSLLADGGETIAIPKPDPSAGKAVEAGVRLNGLNWGAKLDLEIGLNYGWSNQTGYVNGSPLDTRYETVFGKARAYFGASGRIQPYFGVGIGEALLTVKNGASSRWRNADSEFTGFGFMFDAGFSILLARHFGVCAGWSFTPVSFMDVKGTDGEKMIRSFINEAINGPTLELRYYF